MAYSTSGFRPQKYLSSHLRYYSLAAPPSSIRFHFDGGHEKALMSSAVRFSLVGPDSEIDCNQHVPIEATSELMSVKSILSRIYAKLYLVPRSQSICIASRPCTLSSNPPATVYQTKLRYIPSCTRRRRFCTGGRQRFGTACPGRGMSL